jgi:paraquat-inducible protein B
MADTSASDDLPSREPASAVPTAPPLAGGRPPGPTIRRKNRFRLSLVWLVPLAAVIAGLLLIVRSVVSTGPEITLEFRTAEGLEAGRTEIRYKEVVVGRVSEVTLSPDKEKVIARARLDKNAASLAVRDSRFWVVKPRIGIGGVTGLRTLVSGSYIGVDAGESEEKVRAFTGLEAPPFMLRGEPGRSFVLSARDLGSLDVGSPVFYRRTRVGRVVGFTLDPKLDILNVQVFIEAPYDTLVTDDTRFWNASGVDISLNASGLTLNTQSIASVVAGGVAFSTPPKVPPAPIASEGAQFYLAQDRNGALAEPDGPPLRIRLVFDSTMRGLAIGSPVDLLGLEIGVVRSLNLQYDARRRRFPAEVFADIYPGRLGRVREQILSAVPEDRRFNNELLKLLVENGLRAQLKTGNLLTGQMYVGLDFVPDARPVTLDARGATLDVPTIGGTLSDIQPQIAQIISRVGKIRFDEIGDSLKKTLDTASGVGLTLQDTLKSANTAIGALTPEAQKALSGVKGTLDSVQKSLAQIDRNVTDSDAPLQRNAAQAFRVLSDYLQRHPESLLRGKADDPELPLSTNPNTSGARR